VKQTGYLLSCKTSSIAISNHTAGTLTDSGSMGFGKDMQNCIQTVIWYTQSAKATTAPIGSTLKLPGGSFRYHTTVCTKVHGLGLTFTDLLSFWIAEELIRTHTSPPHGK
jgi:hypothetical protein